MIKRKEIELHSYCSCHTEIMDFLNMNRDNLYSKEELFLMLPKDSDGVPIYTIGQLNTALNIGVVSGMIDKRYYKKQCWYGIRERNKEEW